MKFVLIFALVAISMVYAEVSTDKMARLDYHQISEEKLEHYRRVLNNKLPSKASKYDKETFQRRLMDKIDRLNTKLAWAKNGKPTKDEVKKYLKAKNL